MPAGTTDPAWNVSAWEGAPSEAWSGESWQQGVSWQSGVGYTAAWSHSSGWGHGVLATTQQPPQVPSPGSSASFVDFQVQPGCQGVAPEPNREKFRLIPAADGSMPNDRAIIAWAQTFPARAPFVTDVSVQMEYLTSTTADGTEVPHGLRFWPQGGRRRKCGNVTIYLPAGDVWVVGNPTARRGFRAMIKDWAVPAAERYE